MRVTYMPGFCIACTMLVLCMCYACAYMNLLWKRFYQFLQRVLPAQLTGNSGIR